MKPSPVNKPKKASKTRRFGKVAVLMGGISAEREVSLRSGQAVLSALQSQGVDAQGLDTGLRPAHQLVHELGSGGFERCFIALHGRHGEDGTVQGALELLGIPYTGAGVMASSIAMDKPMTKRVWREAGIPTPPGRIAHNVLGVQSALSALGAPMVVKPTHEGSSIGIGQVHALQDCQAAYTLACGNNSANLAKFAEAGTEVLCEQCIQGPEFTCAILGTGSQARALPLVRIEAPKGRYDYHNKYFSNQVRYHLPCGLPSEEEAKIKTLALRAYHSLGCRGWARLDVMVEAATHQPYFLEINTCPGMTDHSLFPMAAKAVGLGFADLCLALLADARLDWTAPAPSAEPSAVAAPVPGGTL